MDLFWIGHVDRGKKIRGWLHNPATLQIFAGEKLHRMCGLVVE